MTAKEKLEAPIDNANKTKRIDELLSEQEQAYHTAVEMALHGVTREGPTIMASIKKAALALEEIFILRGQTDTWLRQEIGAIIVEHLKVRGYPESKYLYVYHALESFGDRFVKPIDHSSIQSLGSHSKRLEHFYSANAQKYYDALKVLKELKHDYNNLARRDLQTIVPECMDIFDENQRDLKRIGIDVGTNSQKSFDGGPERFEDPIRIQKPIPRVPEKMTEELNIWTGTFLPALLNKLTEYPISDPEIEKAMAAGWAALRHAHDPATDDKYRETFADWIQIVQFADESFKHHAASKFKTKTWKGTWRKLTREQIGARQKTIPMWCKWFFETVPGFMAWIAWYRTDKKQYLSGFSEDLSPKLSDRSIR